MTPEPIPAGDAALLLELEPRIDPEVNARAIGIANHVRRERMPGIRDVLSTYRSVAVHFDPLKIDARAVNEALRRAYRGGRADTGGRTLEVPVLYGGDAGPDLAAVATFGGVSEADVIRIHCAQPYRVFMLGFVPGFAYMGPVDPAIAAPRHATPRLKVPAGSVGIAGSQTGIYPRETPGGWQIIGRTDVPLLDGAEHPLFAPGDLVTFTPSPGTGGERGQSLRPAVANHEGSRSASNGGRAFTVLAPGLLTTVQDLGRWGRQHEGVPVGGAMDTVSHRAANRCVGNPDTAATLEVTMQGPELRIERPATIAIAGADLEAMVDGSRVAPQTPIVVKSGAKLRFGERRAGARAYVAFDGGISRSARIGYRVRTGDVLALGPPGRESPACIELPPPSDAPVALRVIPGPQREFFDDRSFEALTAARFTVSSNSNRMAYRLTGARPIPRVSEQEMISDAAFAGGVQVTSAGDAILLMADRQTTGGYPQIATVISADLPTAAQLAPGDSFTFVVCTLQEAMAALEAQEGRLRVH